MNSRILVCAGVLFLVVLGLAFAAHGGVTLVDAVYALRDMVIPAVITALLSRGSAGKWSWGRTAGIFFGVYVAVAALWFFADKLAVLVGRAG